MTSLALSRCFPCPSHSALGQIINTMTGALCALWESVLYFFLIQGQSSAKWYRHEEALSISTAKLKKKKKSPQCGSFIHLAVLPRKSLMALLLLSWSRTP